MPLRVTFDTNTFDKASRPTIYSKGPEHGAMIVVHEALRHGHIQGWTLLKTWPSLSISDSLLEDGSEVIRWAGSRVFLMSMIG
jgi:hypothetical protein